MPYDKSLPYSCPCCGYWNGDMKYDYYKHNKKEPLIKDENVRKAIKAWYNILPRLKDRRIFYENGILWVGVYEFDCGQYDLLDIWLKSGEYYIIDELCGEVE